MNEINVVSVINQMRAMKSQAQGLSAESVSSPQSGFGNVFHQALGKVNELQQQSDALKTRMEMGDPNLSLAEVMVAAQKSSLAFEATLRVRNKAVEVYKDMMNMPV